MIFGKLTEVATGVAREGFYVESPIHEEPFGFDPLDGGFIAVQVSHRPQHKIDKQIYFEDVDAVKYIIEEI